MDICSLTKFDTMTLLPSVPDVVDFWPVADTAAVALVAAARCGRFLIPPGADFSPPRLPRAGREERISSRERSRLDMLRMNAKVKWREKSTRLTNERVEKERSIRLCMGCREEVTTECRGRRFLVVVGSC